MATNIPTDVLVARMSSHKRDCLITEAVFKKTFVLFATAAGLVLPWGCFVLARNSCKQALSPLSLGATFLYKANSYHDSANKYNSLAKEIENFTDQKINNISVTEAVACCQKILLKKQSLSGSLVSFSWIFSCIKRPPLLPRVETWDSNKEFKDLSKHVQTAAGACYDIAENCTYFLGFGTVFAGFSLCFPWVSLGGLVAALFMENVCEDFAKTGRDLEKERLRGEIDFYKTFPSFNNQLYFDSVKLQIDNIETSFLGGVWEREYYKKKKEMNK